MPAPTPEKIFRSSLREIVLLSQANGEPNIPKEVQVLRTGNFYDPRYGTLEITSDTLRTLKKNFDDRVRKIALSFDFKHQSDDIAAGWFNAVELREMDTELWVTVDWTPEGHRKLSDKLFRYVSADFSLNYVDNETMKEYGPCLLGAALTNRPVIKGMDPITLTEGEGKMDEKDKVIQQLQAKIAELEKAAKGDGKADEDPENKDKEMADLKKQLHEANSKNKAFEDKLAEYADKDKADKAKSEKDAEDAKLAEKKKKFGIMMSEGKAVKAQEEAFMKGDMDKFIELAEKTNPGTPHAHGNVDTGVKPEEGKDPNDLVLKLAEEKVAAKKAQTIDKAISLVLSENPELAKAVNQR